MNYDVFLAKLPPTHLFQVLTKVGVQHSPGTKRADQADLAVFALAVIQRYILLSRSVGRNNSLKLRSLQTI